jgi:hypothetical protein
MERILITGTGRCGTTFLVKLFTFLNFDTGFTKDNYREFIFSNCNSGMEKEYTDNHYILKNPHFITQMETILNDRSVKVKTVIIPMRDLQLSAASRVKNKHFAGGLWNSIDEESQIEFYKEILQNYMEVMNKYNVHTIFLDFDKMTQDKEYLFNMLKSILDENNTDFHTYSQAYDQVTQTSKPQLHPPPQAPLLIRPPPRRPLTKLKKRLIWF